MTGDKRTQVDSHPFVRLAGNIGILNILFLKGMRPLGSSIDGVHSKSRKTLYNNSISCNKWGKFNFSHERENLWHESRVCGTSQG